ncbi:hypothetical protein PLESTB_000465900 [Pleodorina starrii]|uniref:Uncharacterized protein n=1 Tax=Pleodorina starrii TaxID=330485 RepID=A0A9W6BG11_9CHLO|nr:hypothetical protein PLESTB_000465900 [Pleodorina starrii]
MDKASRSSGGGAAKLGTLDMQSYLEVMGRQLDEIQAQHQQFCASRPDRVGRLRSQEHAGHLAKRWSSDSQCVSRQPAGLPPEYQELLGASHCDEREALQGSPADDGGSGALRSSSGSQGGARRSLHFGDEASEAGAVLANKRTSPGGSTTTGACAKSRQDLCTFHSTSPPLAGVQKGTSGRNRATSQGPIDSPSISESTSMTQSVTPSAASSRLQTDTPGTPSTHNEQKGATPHGASRLGTVSSSRTSSMRPYAVYDARGVDHVSYATPDSRGGDYPLTASISSSSQGVWQKPHGSAASVSPSPGLSAPQGHTASRSTASDDSSPLTNVAGFGADAGNGAMSGDDDCSPYTLALPGRPFDGIDSEEDDDAQPAGVIRVSESFMAAGIVGPLCAGGAPAGPTQPQAEDGDNQQVTLQAALQPDTGFADQVPRPHSRSGPRTPLVVTSLETEEALRALLATPRFALGGSGTMGASMEGLDVPDDVLAALAKGDGMDLDAALGAAISGSLREHAAQEQSDSPLSRLAVLHQGVSGVAQMGHGRHMVLCPGALTAAPVAVPAAVAARGFDASTRNASGAGGRAAAFAGAASPGALLQGETAHPHQAERPGARVDTSIDVDRFDMLSRTIEISVDGATALSAAGLRDSGSVTCAAEAAAAQQHPQPVLYSLAPKSSVPSDKASRRNTMDGEGRHSALDGVGSRRNRLDGGCRRSTVDGCPALNEYLEEGPALGGEHPHARLYAAPASTGTAATVAGSVRFELRPVSTSPSAGAGGTGHGAAAGSMAAGRTEMFAASASPARVNRGSVNTASPSASSAVRPGGDGDMVLYGSPSQKADAAPSPGVAASPYVPPSPPPGADPAPYLTSPTVPHIGSRLQRNSRKMDEEAMAGVHRDAVTQCGQAAPGDAAGPSSGGAAALRPWSAATGAQSSSRRQLTPMAASGASGASSGVNSVHLDLSLTQAAAAAATGGGRPSATGFQQPSVVAAAAAASPTVLQRQLRTMGSQGSQHLPALHKQQSEQQQQGPPALEVPQLPAYSSFSLAGLSPPTRPVVKVASHDLGVDDTGRPLPFLPSPKDAGAAGASSPCADPTAPSADEGRASRTQLQPLGPPLAAFSRAAALAAAADVGMAAQPPAVERRSAPPLAPTTVSRAPAEGAAAAPPDACSNTRGLDFACVHEHGSIDALEDGSAGLLGAFPSHILPRRAEAAPEQEDNVAGARHAAFDHPELLQGQSPGPPSAASSAAKLSQLKARRQQQWQSQHGLQGGQPQPPGGTTPQSQRPGTLHHEEQGADAAHDHDGSGAARGWAARPASGNMGASGGTEATAARSPLTAAMGSPLLPDAVAEAISRAACSKEDAVVSGELNLGHGISGLSVAIEAGQVKWAWQTDGKGKPVPARLDATADPPPSPGGGGSGGGSGGSSPWASPAAAHGAVRGSGAEWALQQLPAPQWQRHGQLPAGAHAHTEEERGQQLADERPSVLQPRQPGGNYMGARRRSDYSVAERQLAIAGGGALPHNYALSAGGFPTQEQHQPRLPSATDGGGQPSSKAMALLRLKQQSIMRHNVQVSSVKE